MQMPTTGLAEQAVMLASFLVIAQVTIGEASSEEWVEAASHSGWNRPTAGPDLLSRLGKMTQLIDRTGEKSVLNAVFFENRMK